MMRCDVDAPARRSGDRSRSRRPTGAASPDRRTSAPARTSSPPLASDSSARCRRCPSRRRAASAIARRSASSLGDRGREASTAATRHRLPARRARRPRPAPTPPASRSAASSAPDAPPRRRAAASAALTRARNGRGVLRDGVLALAVVLAGRSAAPTLSTSSTGWLNHFSRAAADQLAADDEHQQRRNDGQPEQRATSLARKRENGRPRRRSTNSLTMLRASTKHERQRASSGRRPTARRAGPR